MGTAQTETAKARRREERRQRILEAATEVFLQEGYDNASIDAVIEKAGGSKRTIYEYFGSKEDLFAAIVAENCQRVMRVLPSDTGDDPDLAATLMRFGREYLSLLMTPTALALYRTVVAESVRFPRLAEVFFVRGPGEASVGLAETVCRFQREGQIGVEDPRLAAEKFVGMIRDDLHLRVVLGLRDPPNREEIERSVQRAVKIFLDGCRAR